MNNKAGGNCIKIYFRNYNRNMTVHLHLNSIAEIIIKVLFYFLLASLACLE